MFYTKRRLLKELKRAEEMLLATKDTESEKIRMEFVTSWMIRYFLTNGYRDK